MSRVLKAAASAAAEVARWSPSKQAFARRVTRTAVAPTAEGAGTVAAERTAGAKAAPSR